MWGFLRRGLFSIFALFVISFLVFLLTNVVPGSPASAVLDVDTPEEEVRAWQNEQKEAPAYIMLPTAEQKRIIKMHEKALKDILY